MVFYTSRRKKKPLVTRKLFPLSQRETFIVSICICPHRTFATLKGIHIDMGQHQGMLIIQTMDRILIISACGSKRGWGSYRVHRHCLTHPHFSKPASVSLNMKMAFWCLSSILVLGLALIPALSQSTCPSCNCRVSKPPIIDQLINTKIARVLNGQPSKSILSLS